jgi:glucose-6-phosphate dehydrogenase assembly protein OpcA
MKESLLNRLIEKNYFTTGTVIRSRLRGMDLSGVELHSFEKDFVTVKLGKSRKTDELVVMVKSELGEQKSFKSGDITEIDGMTPERFAQNYLLDPEGNDLKPFGKRRGRKPRDWDEDDDEFYA